MRITPPFPPMIVGTAVGDRLGLPNLPAPMPALPLPMRMMLHGAHQATQTPQTALARALLAAAAGNAHEPR